MSDDTDLPKALVKKIAKSKLVSLERDNGTQEVRDIQISKDALLALSESARVFIHYLTATGVTRLLCITSEPACIIYC